MQTPDFPVQDRRSPRRLHVVFGSGGTKAVLAGTGAALCFHVSGLTDWETIGAASGGSIPAGVLAAAIPARVFLHELLNTDMERLLEPNTHLIGRLLAILSKYRHERVRPRRGAYSNRRLRKFLNRLVPNWPANFWTVASCAHGQVLFTAGGVYKYAAEPAAPTLISPRPPSFGQAVCASCAMPGIIDSVKFAGELLYDGALSGDGEVPVDVIGRHFAGEHSLTLAIDIGPDPIKQRRWLRFLWTVFCGGTCDTGIDAKHPTAREGLIIVKPAEIKGFHALEFKLSRNQKWHAVIAGFVATAKAVCDNNLVDDAAQIRLQAFSNRLAQIESQGGRKQLSKNIETFLCENNLFCEET
jgi:predicted acylesterase/phospholipase RssA